MSTTENGETLWLKWGTLKGWDFRPGGAAMTALAAYSDAGECASGAMMQEDTIEQIDALCAIVDAVDGEIRNDWTGEVMSKEEAKAYIRQYERPYEVKSNGKGQAQ
jgi:hypothetical protein